MIDKQKLISTINEAIAGSDIFLVDARISPANEIVVEIDSPEGNAISSRRSTATSRTTSSRWDRPA